MYSFVTTFCMTYLGHWDLNMTCAFHVTYCTTCKLMLTNILFEMETGNARVSLVSKCEVV